MFDEWCILSACFHVFLLCQGKTDMLLASEGVPTVTADALTEHHMTCASSEHQSESRKGHTPEVTQRYKKPKSTGTSPLLRKAHLPVPLCNKQAFDMFITLGYFSPSLTSLESSQT